MPITFAQLSVFSLVGCALVVLISMGLESVISNLDAMLVPCQHGTPFNEISGDCSCIDTPFTGKYCGVCNCKFGAQCMLGGTTPKIGSDYGCRCPLGTKRYGFLCDQCNTVDFNTTCKGTCLPDFHGPRCDTVCKASLTFEDTAFPNASGDAAICRATRLGGGTCNVCSGHGTCENGDCECDKNWFDSDKSKCALTCPSSGTGALCNGHGTCQLMGGKPSCKCSNGYRGTNCDVKCPDIDLTGTICNNHGVCLVDYQNDPPVASCECNQKYRGTSCQYECPGEIIACSGHGTCGETGNCICDAFASSATWQGPACNCSSFASCNGHGTCNTDGQCECIGHWDGKNCLECEENWWGSQCNFYCDANGASNQTYLGCHGNGNCAVYDMEMTTERIACACGKSITIYDDGAQNTHYGEYEPTTNCGTCVGGYLPEVAVADVHPLPEGIHIDCQLYCNSATCNNLGTCNELWGTPDEDLCICDNGPNNNKHVNGSTFCTECQQDWYPQAVQNDEGCSNFCVADIADAPYNGVFPSQCADGAIDCVDCSGNGACGEDGLCLCDDGFTGEQCNIQCQSASGTICGGHGECVPNDMQVLLQHEFEFTGDSGALYKCSCDPQDIYTTEERQDFANRKANNEVTGNLDPPPPQEYFGHTCDYHCKDAPWLNGQRCNDLGNCEKSKIETPLGATVDCKNDNECATSPIIQQITSGSIDWSSEKGPFCDKPNYPPGCPNSNLTNDQCIQILTLQRPSQARSKECMRNSTCRTVLDSHDWHQWCSNVISVQSPSQFDLCISPAATWCPMWNNPDTPGAECSNFVAKTTGVDISNHLHYCYDIDKAKFPFKITPEYRHSTGVEDHDAAVSQFSEFALRHPTLSMDASSYCEKRMLKFEEYVLSMASNKRYLCNGVIQDSDVCSTPVTDFDTLWTPFTVKCLGKPTQTYTSLLEAINARPQGCLVSEDQSRTITAPIQDQGFGAICAKDEDCDSNSCYKNTCCSTFFVNRQNCAGCNNVGYCQGCVSGSSWNGTQCAYDGTSCSAFGSVWVDDIGCTNADVGETCEVDSNCASNNCLGGKCCSPWFSGRSAENCGACDNSGYCASCLPGTTWIPSTGCSSGTCPEGQTWINDEGCVTLLSGTEMTDALNLIDSTCDNMENLFPKCQVPTDACNINGESACNGDDTCTPNGKNAICETNGILNSTCKFGLTSERLSFSTYKCIGNFDSNHTCPDLERDFNWVHYCKTNNPVRKYLNFGNDDLNEGPQPIQTALSTNEQDGDTVDFWVKTDSKIKQSASLAVKSMIELLSGNQWYTFTRVYLHQGQIQLNEISNLESCPIDQPTCQEAFAYEVDQWIHLKLSLNYGIRKVTLHYGDNVLEKDFLCKDDPCWISHMTRIDIEPAAATTYYDQIIVSKEMTPPSIKSSCDSFPYCNMDVDYRAKCIDVMLNVKYPSVLEPQRNIVDTCASHFTNEIFVGVTADSVVKNEMEELDWDTYCRFQTHFNESYDCSDLNYTYLESYQSQCEKWIDPLDGNLPYWNTYRSSDAGGNCTKDSDCTTNKCRGGFCCNDVFTDYGQCATCNSNGNCAVCEVGFSWKAGLGCGEINFETHNDPIDGYKVTGLGYDPHLTLCVNEKYAFKRTDPQTVYNRHTLRVVKEVECQQCDTGTYGSVPISSLALWQDVTLGASADYTFTETGTYYYACTAHSNMVGKITVQQCGGQVSTAVDTPPTCIDAALTYDWTTQCQNIDDAYTPSIIKDSCPQNCYRHFIGYDMCPLRNQVFSSNTDIPFSISNCNSVNWLDHCLKVAKDTHDGVCTAVDCDCDTERSQGMTGDACELHCSMSSDGSPCGEKTGVGICEFTTEQKNQLQQGPYPFEMIELEGECNCFLAEGKSNCDQECSRCNNVSYATMTNQNVNYEARFGFCDAARAFCQCLPPYTAIYNTTYTTWKGQTRHKLERFYGLPSAFNADDEYRIRMMQGRESFIRNYLVPTSTDANWKVYYDQFRDSPAGFTCKGQPCDAHDFVMLGNLEDTSFKWNFDCNKTCPAVDPVTKIGCSGHGRCGITGTCICDTARVIKGTDAATGNTIHIKIFGGEDYDRSKFLVTKLDQTGWRGEDCSLKCPMYDEEKQDMSEVCSGHGVCDNDAVCICSLGYVGDKCQFRCPGHIEGNKNVCSGHGTCQLNMIEIVTDATPTDSEGNPVSLARNCTGNWTDWSTCDGIRQTRSFETTQTAAFGGTPCPESPEFRSCSLTPVNCAGSWGNWGTCVTLNATTSEGTQQRTYSVTQQPEHGGLSCPASPEVRSCSFGVTNCEVSAWTAWGNCVNTWDNDASNGQRTRTRTITQHPNSYGSACPDLSESETCTMSPVNCQGSWSALSSCVNNFQSKTYTVTQQAAWGGSACPTQLVSKFVCSDCNTVGSTTECQITAHKCNMYEDAAQTNTLTEYCAENTCGTDTSVDNCELALEEALSITLYGGETTAQESVVYNRCGAGNKCCNQWNTDQLAICNRDGWTETCVANSAWSGGACTCDSGYEASADGHSCVVSSRRLRDAIAYSPKEFKENKQDRKKMILKRKKNLQAIINQYGIIIGGQCSSNAECSSCTWNTDTPGSWFTDLSDNEDVPWMSKADCQAQATSAGATFSEDTDKPGPGCTRNLGNTAYNWNPGACTASNPSDCDCSMINVCVEQHPCHPQVGGASTALACKNRMTCYDAGALTVNCLGGVCTSPWMGAREKLHCKAASLWTSMAASGGYCAECNKDTVWDSAQGGCTPIDCNTTYGASGAKFQFIENVGCVGMAGASCNAHQDCLSNKCLDDICCDTSYTDTVNCQTCRSYSQSTAGLQDLCGQCITGSVFSSTRNKCVGLPCPEGKVWENNVGCVDQFGVADDKMQKPVELALNVSYCSPGMYKDYKTQICMPVTDHPMVQLTLYIDEGTADEISETFDCEVWGTNRLKCAECSCFQDYVYGKWASFQCETCLRGYGKKQCRDVCPAYDGENDITMCSGHGKCKFGSQVVAGSTERLFQAGDCNCGTTPGVVNEAGTKMQTYNMFYTELFTVTEVQADVICKTTAQLNVDRVDTCYHYNQDDRTCATCAPEFSGYDCMYKCDKCLAGGTCSNAPSEIRSSVCTCPTFFGTSGLLWDFNCCPVGFIVTDLVTFNALPQEDNSEDRLLAINDIQIPAKYTVGSTNNLDASKYCKPCPGVTPDQWLDQAAQYDVCGGVFRGQCTVKSGSTTETACNCYENNGGTEDDYIGPFCRCRADLPEPYVNAQTDYGCAQGNVQGTCLAEITIINDIEIACAPPIGHYVDATGINPAPAGSYVPNDGTLYTQATLCPAGKYQGSTGQTDCIDAFIGGYTSGGAAWVTLCDAGKYQDQTGTTACKGCPSGKFMPWGRDNYNEHDDVGDCTDCPSGKSSGPGATECLDCAQGKYTVSGVCTDCAGGKYLNGVGSAESDCKNCAAGKYSTGAAPSCSYCPVGKSSTSGSTSCTTCTSGKYFDDIYCKNCPKGKYSENFNDFHDVGNPYWIYWGTIRGCKLCAAGKYQDETGKDGSNSCKSCGSGAGSSNGASSCSSCAKGKYESMGICYNCPAGQYTDQTGQTSCKSCSCGKYASGGGNTGCRKCRDDNGCYYNVATGSSGCANAGGYRYPHGNGCGLAGSYPWCWLGSWYCSGC